jgi:hypothetical protein
VLLIQRLDLATGATVEMLSIDRGPGMADVQACLTDGYSTGGTPGHGLGAVRRLSTDFDIFSTPAGTVILSRVTPAAPRQVSSYHWGAISLPAPHETVCGDTWRIAIEDGRLAVMLADGLGHGPNAAEAASRAGTVFEAQPFEDPDALIERAHRVLAGSRGATVGTAAISGDGLRYAGVGNISATLIGGDRSRGLPSQNGTVGVQMRRVQVAAYDWPSPGRLIMHSDGLSNRWTLHTYPGLVSRHPAVQAGVLWRDCTRGRDDATIVVVGRSAGSGHG